LGHPEVPEGTPPEPASPDLVRLSRFDLVTLRKALSEGWRVPDSLLNEALYQCADILAGPSKRREKLSAMRVLVAMTRVDLAARKRPGDVDTAEDAKPRRLLIPGADTRDSE
jgi:hypothetical protein